MVNADISPIDESVTTTALMFLFLNNVEILVET